MTVDVARPSSDGTYWLSKIREHHPVIERAARNRFRPGGLGSDYLFCDEDGDGVTEEERDEMISSTWKDEFLRREGLVRRLLLPDAPPPADEAAPGCPPWPPPDYDPMSLNSYEFVVNFYRGGRRSRSRSRRSDGTAAEELDVTTIVATVDELSPSPGCDTLWDSHCSRYRGGSDFGSSVMIDLTPWKGELPKLFTSGRFDDPEDRPDMEVIVIKRMEDEGTGNDFEGSDGERRVEVATLYGGSLGNTFGNGATNPCCTKPFHPRYHFRAFSGPGWFGDEYFEDIHGEEEGNPDRPWLPRVEPYLHERGGRGESDSRWDLHLGIKWGGKGICEREEPMGDRDVRAFLEHGLEWRRVRRESEMLPYLHDDTVRGGRRCWSRALYPCRSVRRRKPGADLGRPEERRESIDSSGWSTYSYDLYDILPRFTFLLDLFEMKGEDDGTPSSPGTESSCPINTISVDIPTSDEVQDGKLTLDVTDIPSRDAVRDWLSSRTGAEIGGMVTVIERGTGKQAQLFVGHVITKAHARLLAGLGYKYFPSFAALHYFSNDEAYSRVIWPETVLHLAAGGGGRDGRVSFAVNFHWFDSRRQSYHSMEDHLVMLFLKHVLV